MKKKHALLLLLLPGGIILYLLYRFIFSSRPAVGSGVSMGGGASGATGGIIHALGQAVSPGAATPVASASAGTSFNVNSLIGQSASLIKSAFGAVSNWISGPSSASLSLAGSSGGAGLPGSSAINVGQVETGAFDFLNPSSNPFTEQFSLGTVNSNPFSLNTSAFDPLSYTSYLNNDSLSQVDSTFQSDQNFNLFNTPAPSAPLIDPGASDPFSPASIPDITGTNDFNFNSGNGY